MCIAKHAENQGEGKKIKKLAWKGGQRLCEELKPRLVDDT